MADADDKRVPEWLLERMAAGEVGDHLRARADALDADDLQQRLTELRASSAEILAAHPPARVTAEIERRAAPAPAARRPRIWVGVGGLAAAGAAALALAVVGIEGSSQRSGAPPAPAIAGGERAKGDARLVIHRKTPSGSELLTTGAPARAGDRLQLSYAPGSARHGVIVSIDGAGTVTLHHPARADGSTALAASELVSLDHSYELDDAPAFERFFFVTGTGPLDVSAVLAAAEALADSGRGRAGSLALDESLRQSALMLRKETSR